MIQHHDLSINSGHDAGGRLSQQKNFFISLGFANVTILFFIFEVCLASILQTIFIETLYPRHKLVNRTLIVGAVKKRVVFHRVNRRCRILTRFAMQNRTSTASLHE